MSCAARIPARFAKSPLRGVSEPTGFEVAGTWDFKWPLGTKIRVVFQRLAAELGISDAAFDEARGLTVEYAKRWKPPAGVTLDFEGDAIEVLEDLAAPLGPVNSVTDQHRSPFLPGTPLKNHYDVLVSLQPLPAVRIDPFRPLGSEVEEVQFPLSELGSYSRRADFGSPTVFLGPFGKAWPKTATNFDPSAAFVDYFESELGKHVVVHEFGHVLGLPHSHQYPRLVLPNGPGPFTLEQIDAAREAFYRDKLELKTVMETIFGVDVNDTTVKAHLLAAWRGNLDFSDWHSFTQAELNEHAASGKLNSVMRLPFYSCTVRNHAPCKTCDQGEYDPKVLVTAPEARDMDTLSLMYDPSYIDAGQLAVQLTGTKRSSKREIAREPRYT